MTETAPGEDQAEPSAPSGQVLSLLAILGLPAAGIGIVLVLLQKLDFLAGLVALAAYLAIAFLLLRRHLVGLEAVRRFADRLESGAAPLPTVIRRSAVALELGSAVARLERTLHNRLDDVTLLARTRETILDSVPDPLLTLDQQGRIVRGNLPARLLLGKAIEGRDLSQVLRTPVILEAVQAVLAGGGARVVDLTLSQPVERDFSIGVQPLPARAPDGTSLLIAMHDVTTLRRAEQMRGDFVANASHELRTPLATLIGFIETLQGPARDDEEARDRVLAIMQEQATRMSRLVDDLLSLSRIELNEHQPPTRPLDLGEVIESVAAALELQAARRKIRLAVALPDGLPPVVGDADQLAQVFQNLIDNAIKYARSGSVIEIAASRPARLPAAFPKAPLGAVAVAVRDESDGIAREHLPRLTERFYRVDPARSKQAGGTGLGLAIVKHILNRHRGTLTIESELGRGSIFTVYLPAATERQAGRPAAPHPRSAPPPS